MKRLISGLIVLAVLALIGAALAWSLPRDDDPVEQDRGVPRQQDSASRISSSGVEQNISRRLTARSGREVDVVCPPKIDELVGTTFDCQAYFAGDKTMQTVAKVKITGGGGAFTWTSENAARSEPTP